MTGRMRPTRLAAFALGVLALLLTAAASGAPINAYTASAQPTVVKPSLNTVYIISLKNDAASPERAQRARIGIPSGFSVSAASGASSAAGSCTAASWIADGTLIANGAVNLKKSGGSTTELCPDGTLTVSITASAPTEGVSTWSTELLRESAPFALQGSQPTVRVDGMAPVVSIDSAPANPSNDPSPSFTFFADEPAVTFACKLDDEAFASCASPRSYTALADGEHTFQLRGTDEAGNAGPTVTHTWTIGTVAPLTTIDSTPENPTSSGSANFTFSSGASGATFECKLDQADFGPCTSPTAYSDLPDGQHTFQVKGTDGTGTGSPIGHTWTVDTMPPNAAIGTKPATLVNSTTASFTFSADESGTTFECKLDDGGFAACLSPKAYSSLGDGPHTFAVQATDRAGNVGPAATYAWTVDTTPPNTTITANPPPASPSTSASFSFTATEVGSSFECKLDTQVWVACLPPWTYEALSEGAHTFSARATDGAGNVDPTPSSVGWVVDTIPPDTTIDSKPPSLTNSSTASFTFSATEAGTTFECKFDLEADFSACGASKTFTSLVDGQHVLTVRAGDAAGNLDSSPASYTWTVDTVAPQTMIGSTPPSQSASGLASFTFSSSEPTSTFECKIDSGAYTACSSPKSYLLLDGLHTFEVRATDAAKNTDTTAATYSWRIDTAEPDTTITSAPSGSVSSRDATILFSSPDPGVTFECKLDTDPFSPCTSPKLYSNLPEAPHTFEVRARDGAGNTDLSPATASWVVDVTNPDTSILTAPLNPTNSRNATIAFSSNESAVTYECKLDTGGFAACTSPKGYSNLSEAPHTVQVRATDAAGNVDASPATYSWTIDVTPPQTTIDSGPDNPTNKGEAMFTVSSTDPSAGFECRLDSAAYALCTSPKTFDALPDGSHTFNVRARDPAGNVDPTPAIHTWTIDTVAPAPTIALPIDGSATNDTTPAFAGTAGSAFGDSAIVTVRVYAGPAAGGAPFHTFAVTRVGSNWAGASAPLAEGVYTGRAEQVDTAGNTGLSAPTTFTIDTGGPGAAIIEKPANPSSSGTATFRFSSTDPAATFKCRLDAGDFVACVSPLTYEGLAPGGHTFAVNATDRAGNTGGSATYSWTIVAPPPQPAPAPPPATVDVVPPHEVAKVRVKAANASVTLTWVLPTDADFDRVTVIRTAPGKSVRGVAIYEGGNRGVTDRRLKNGVRYRYRITTRDKAGNTSAGVQVVATPQAPLFAPLNGASVTAPPLLRWQATPRATYYNVQVWLVQSFGQAKAVRPVKVLSAWPSTTRLKLGARWRFDGKAYRLVPGRYRWYVFPGFGKRAAARYGALLGESTFTVKSKQALTKKR